MDRQPSKNPETRSCQAVVVGAGLIGLSIAFELTRRGCEVILIDAAPTSGTGATRVAAGMLAPVGELGFGEPALLEMNLASAEIYPEFVAAVERRSGVEVGYRRLGGLHVALDRDEAGELRRVLDLQLDSGLCSRWLGPGASREIEPGLAPGLNGAILVEGDGMVDPRALVSALVTSLNEVGVPVLTSAEVVSLELSGERAAGVGLADGTVIRADTVVAAVGAEAGRSGWLPEADRPPVRPVKGQTVELRGDSEDPVCGRIVASERVYLVPRTDGRLIVGATVEDLGFDTAVTAGGIHELLREAYRLLPDVAELEFIEATAGLRPATPDNLPVVGRATIPGLIMATGHYRNGILLAPVTAQTVAAMVEAAVGSDDEASAESLSAGPMAAADPGRFGDQQRSDGGMVAAR